MKITLTQGEFALIDVCDYIWLSQWKWYYSRGYAVRTINDLKKHRKVYMHNAIMAYYGLDKGRIDHINRNPCDNRKCNLRAATLSNNQWNSGIPRNNTSGYKGVRYQTSDGKWRATIGVEGKQIHLGMFTCKHGAALAYNEAARIHHREFANLNTIEE